ncbi:hypothetical protein LWI29_036758 [Acer saccharum]|uniref:Protein FAR1-RELATED SEQUENCE n=1 Tax=Acer saccharum TaxID=4024 RepID=A0AA39RWI1_ACESA|nr:hypothetical protein LWI29_036758 [Acer saccharum]
MDTVNSEIGDPSKGSLKQILWKSCSSTCSNTDDNVHIPQVNQECKPMLGQEFASLDDVYDFYNKYAKEAGFSVRINSSWKNKENNEILRKEYVCSKEGISANAKGVVSETKRRRGITREGCNAKLAVLKSKTDTYTDSAMTKAISQTLPNTVHTYCSWHIINKLSEQLNEVTYRDYYSDFQKCIWESCTREEFDSKWKEVIENCNLNDNTWLHSMYEVLSEWVPTYVNHVFSAGMLGSQQSELSHAFFKSCVSKKNSPVDFIVLFNRD